MRHDESFKLYWQSDGRPQYDQNFGPLMMRAWIDWNGGDADLWRPEGRQHVAGGVHEFTQRSLRHYTVAGEWIAPLPRLFEQIGVFSSRLESLVASEEQRPDYFELDAFTGVIGLRPFQFSFHRGVPGTELTQLGQSLYSALSAAIANARITKQGIG
ncbi:hypothetical protein [Lysobacter sp. CA199]|uniref:hypothetical protein n=1 Tax=Lysobacter sp. CA199 TaxID=3455608 RepID=UPI003F8D08FC